MVGLPSGLGDVGGAGLAAKLAAFVLNHLTPGKLSTQASAELSQGTKQLLCASAWCIPSQKASSVPLKARDLLGARERAGRETLFFERP
eukprot:scaffold81739_cov13-Tisochrysis_lutea.AAC.1